MLDYSGDMDYFQDQLSAVGITSEQFDMCDYMGLTKRELQGIVDRVVKYVKEQKEGKA